MIFNLNKSWLIPDFGKSLKEFSNYYMNFIANIYYDFWLRYQNLYFYD